MKVTNRILYIIWAVLYVLCIVFSAIAEPVGGWLIPELILSLAFFIPPAILLYRGVRNSHGFTLRLIRNLSIAVLAATTVTLCMTFLSVGMRASTEFGVFLQILLMIVSAPMLCSPVWGISLFFWACLMMVCLKYRKLTAPAPVKKAAPPYPKKKKKKR